MLQLSKELKSVNKLFLSAYHWVLSFDISSLQEIKVERGVCCGED